ncbi:MAG: oligosaccharide flippase family protein [Bacteroidota bacterium]
MQASPSTRRASVVKNVSWMMMSHGLVKPAWFLFITAACMQVLGASGYGVLTTSLALAMLAKVISDFGSSYYTIREVARSTSRASLFITNILIGRLLLALLGSVSVFAASVALGYAIEHRMAVLAASVYVIGFSLLEYTRSFFRAFEVLRNEAISVLVEKAIVIGLGLAALMTFKTPFGTLAGMATGMLLALVFTFLWVHTRYARFTWSLLRWSVVWGTFRAAVPIGLFLLFSIVLLSSGPIIVEVFLGKTAAGHYGAAYRVLEAAQTLTAIVIAAVLPRLAAHIYAGRYHAYRQLLRNSAAALLVITLVGALLLSVLGTYIVGLLAGTQSFEAGGAFLEYVGWALPFMSMTHLLMAALIAADRHWYVAGSLIFCALGGVGLNLLLIPSMGLNGAGLVLIGGHVVASMLGLFGVLSLRSTQDGLGPERPELPPTGFRSGDLAHGTEEPIERAPRNT